MAKLAFNSIPSNILTNSTGDTERSSIVNLGRAIAYDYAVPRVNEVNRAGFKACDYKPVMTTQGYKEANEKFFADSCIYAAKIACAQSGEIAPENYDEFKRQSRRFYGNSAFLRVLSGIYTEVIAPIVPATYSEAVSMMSETVEVGFGETAQITIGSNDIPVFQDSAWGASMSAPHNTFYTKDYYLTPKPKTCEIDMKWMQLIGIGGDFGQFAMNLVAGMYGKTMGMWNAAMQAAISGTTFVPSNLKYVFNNANWDTAKAKVGGLNGAFGGNLFATGSEVALGKVLPYQATGSTNVNMDAALAMMLGEEYNRMGRLSEFKNVRLIPMMDAIVPGTQNTAPATILPANTIYMMATNGRKPMTIAYDAATPITIDFEPTHSADMKIGMNMTIALDIVATFASKIAVFTI